MNRMLFITGPTASGKSSLAVRLAKSLGGEVLNIDSVQVYRGCDTGTAKIPLHEQENIPHHLLDIRNPDEPLDAAGYLEEAGKVIRSIEERGLHCIAAGGTTLYITLLLHGLAAIPGGSSEVRKKLAALTLPEMYSRLQVVDPASAARIHPNDRIRIERALETWEISGEKASEIQANHAFQSSPHKGLLLVLCLPRDELYARIDRRTELMFQEGIVEETRELMQRYGDVWPLKAVGYAQAASLLRSEVTLEEAIAQVKKETRNLAKRQCTYWRNEPLKRGWVMRPGDEEDGIELKSRPDFYASHKHVSDFRTYDFTLEQLVEKLSGRLHHPFDRNEVWYLNAGRLADAGVEQPAEKC